MTVRHLLGLLLFALLASSCDATRDAGQPVRFNLGWLPQGSVAGVIVAREKGFYSDAGLDVSLARGFGGVRTVNEIDQGMFEFGYADPVAVLMNRSGGGQARLIGTINNRWPGGLCFLAGPRAPRRPADLAGKTIGGAHGAPVQVLLPLLLRQNGVDAGRVDILQMDPSVIDAALVEGVIDAAECWLGSNKALIDRRGAEAGKPTGWLPYSAFGLDLYGSGIVASDSYLASHPAIARKFLAATYRGYHWAAEHPAEAADIVARLYPTVDRAIVRQQIEETAELAKGSGPAGWVDPARMTRALSFLTEAYGDKGSVKANDIYTNQFLPIP